MISVNNNLIQIEEFEPYVIREGVFGATFNKKGESLFLRMELLTKENEKSWTCFKDMNNQIASDCRGILSSLVIMAGKSDYPKYEEAKKFTGFTNEEYTTFTEKAISLKKKTENKIVSLLKANFVGSNYMKTSFYADQRNYVVYI